MDIIINSGTYNFSNIKINIGNNKKVLQKKLPKIIFNATMG
jgi:hypothetical protein